MQIKEGALGKHSLVDLEKFTTITATAAQAQIMKQMNLAVFLKLSQGTDLV